MREALAGFPLLAALDEAERGHLASALQRVDLEAGALIFEEGAEADALWLVVSGDVVLASRRAEGHGLCGAGRGLGALGLLAGGRREATARAASPCTLLRLSREGFEELRRCAPRAACALLLGVVRESAGALRRALAELERHALG